MFQPGNNLGKGCPPGVRNRVSYELRERLKTRGDKDPAEFLSEIVSNENEPKELRISASIGLMPYLYNKLTPVAPLVSIEEPISISRATTIKQAYGNIAYISELTAQGRIDKDWGSHHGMHNIPPWFSSHFLMNSEIAQRYPSRQFGARHYALHRLSRRDLDHRLAIVLGARDSIANASAF